VRVVIVEDPVLLREGIAALLQDNDIEVVAMADDGPGLLRIVEGHKPDLAICDVRLPPTFTDEGIHAALEARRRHPQLAVLVLSQDVEPAYTADLLQEGEAGIGYLLKERVSEVRTFIEAVRRVAAGGTALDREVVSTLVNDRRMASSAAVDPIETLRPRERETLELVAQGRSNSAIARELVVTPSAVEKHISSIFTKLDLPVADDDHRRVLAVLAYLRATDQGEVAGA
jgi:DNA-binding NarL/FixJ family response regulator